MSHYLKLLKAARQQANLQDEATLGLLTDLLETVLLLEGPPAAPIEGVSEDFREGYVLSGTKRHRPDFYAYTWTTGPWRCLLMDLPSVVMRRAIPLGSKGHQAPQNEAGAEAAPQAKRFQMATDWFSQKFQTRIASACEAFDIATSIIQGAVVMTIGEERTLLAWRRRQRDETFADHLRGDADNYLKNGLDGLMRARVLSNDRGVIRATATKEIPDSWMTPTRKLDDRLSETAHKLHEGGKTLQEVREALWLTHTQMTTFFPNYLPPSHGKGGAKPRISAGALPPEEQKALVAQFQQLIGNKVGYKAASLQTRASKALADQAFYPMAMKALKTAGSLYGAGKVLRTAPKIVRRVVATTEEGQALLQSVEASTFNPRAASADKSAAALNRAMDRVARGESPAKAAKAEGANLLSLRSKLQRARKASGGTSAPAGAPTPSTAPPKVKKRPPSASKEAKRKGGDRPEPPTKAPKKSPSKARPKTP